MTTLTSRVFMNGNSQAVRIPREFRLEAHEVEISRNDSGDLLIRAVTPSNKKRGAQLLEALQAFDDDFIECLEASRKEQPALQEREEF